MRLSPFPFGFPILVHPEVCEPSSLHLTPPTLPHHLTRHLVLSVPSLDCLSHQFPFLPPHSHRSSSGHRQVSPPGPCWFSVVILGYYMLMVYTPAIPNFLQSLELSLMFPWLRVVSNIQLGKFMLFLRNLF